MNLTLKQFKTKGFTLVEILIVVIIVGLLSGIAVSKLGDSKTRAVVAAKKSAAAEINKAVQAQYIKGNYMDQSGFIWMGVMSGANDASDATGVANLVSMLAGNGTYNSFTQTSGAEMRRAIKDTTPDGGYLTRTGTTHKDLEIVFNEGTYTGPVEP